MSASCETYLRPHSSELSGCMIAASLFMLLVYYTHARNLAHVDAQLAVLDRHALALSSDSAADVRATLPEFFVSATTQPRLLRTIGTVSRSLITNTRCVKMKTGVSFPVAALLCVAAARAAPPTPSDAAAPSPRTL